MTGTLLRNALCTSFDGRPPLYGDVRVEGDLIAAVGQHLSAETGDSVEDLHGALLMPGLVCAHTHLYSSLSRGMPPPATAPESFPEILASIWWKLDKALDEETIYLSAVAGAIEALRCGVTTIFDHHASPNAITGSLDSIAAALTAIGVRGVLCYETSDRDGLRKRDEGLAENEGFVKRHAGHGMLRGLVGAHASFTLSDETLHMLGDLVERLDSGLHIHVAEDLADERLTRERYGRGIMERLDGCGLLRPRSVLAHAVHLTGAEFALAATRKPWLIHNPRSNMNNAVGHGPLQHFGTRCALGTDGFPADMFEEARAAWFRNAESVPRVGAGTIAGMLMRGGELATEMFDRPVGMIAPGAAADLVVLDYIPPTPLTVNNAAGHLLFGLRSGMVRSVMVGGTWALRDRTIVNLDEAKLLRDASAAAARLWRKMDD